MHCMQTEGGQYYTSESWSEIIDFYPIAFQDEISFNIQA